MPVVFLGHGSPMNAIEQNDFTETLARLGRSLPRPRAVLCISAHWMTEGTWVTRMKQPKTIHDFYGFPQELFDIQYPAPGSPEVADLVIEKVGKDIHADEEMWGLDHGTWSVLRHVYPRADVPVLQLSLHLEQPAEYHFALGRKLSVLREQGILIVGSGNVVHNLRRIRFEANAEPYDWAIEFDEWIAGRLEARDFDSLVHRYRDTEPGRSSVPTPEHYYPFLYVLGAAGDDRLVTEYEEIQNASISMRSISFHSS